MHSHDDDDCGDDDDDDDDELLLMLLSPPPTPHSISLFAVVVMPLPSKMHAAIVTRWENVINPIDLAVLESKLENLTSTPNSSARRSSL